MRGELNFGRCNFEAAKYDSPLILKSLNYLCLIKIRNQNWTYRTNTFSSGGKMKKHRTKLH